VRVPRILREREKKEREGGRERERGKEEGKRGEKREEDRSAKPAC
jgi:hypothetical protein